MTGNLLTGMSTNREVRIYVAETSEMVASAQKTHDLSPMSTAALGRTITGAAMMGMMSKIEKEKLTLQIKGSGEIQLMVAVADTKGHVKAYTSEPHASLQTNDLGKIAVGQAVGKEGQVVVIRDMGMKDPFIGQSDLVSGEIAEDLTYYFGQSEQQATAIGLGVFLTPDARVKSAGGFLVQLLPEASEATIEQLESNLSGMKSITQLFEEGLTIEQIAGQVFAGLGLDELERYPLYYQCDCSKEKMGAGLKSLGKSTLTEILTEDGGAELTCHFCNTKYQFSRDDLKTLIESMA